MGSSHDRCSLHPQRRLVGICAFCLREHLTRLIESINPDDDDIDCCEEDADLSNHHVTPQPQPVLHQGAAQAMSGNMIHLSSAKAGLHSQPQPKLEESTNIDLAPSKTKHGYHFLPQSPYQGGVRGGFPASPLILSVSSYDKNRSPPPSCRQSNVSESDARMYNNLGQDVHRKKRSSWFSISKPKGSLLDSPLQQMNSPQWMVQAGRKSASDAIGHTPDHYRQAYIADLESISEINLVEAAIMVDNSLNRNGDAHINSSWISSFFHRRKGSRLKSESRENSTNGVDESPASSMLNGSINQSPKPSIDAGRLSWDGARPNFKQMLKKIEARNKHQRRDCSPLHVAEHQARDIAMSGDAASLQKCKTVAAARSRLGMEVPKNLSQVSASPMLQPWEKQGDLGGGMEFKNEDDERDFPRSRSWGRALMSPLLGFRQNGRRGMHESAAVSNHHYHEHHSRYGPMKGKNAIGVPPDPGSSLSPLRRSKPVSDVPVHYTQ